MKKEVGFLGLGLCGGNITNEFEALEYNCAYLNTSKEDLNSLKDATHIIHIENAEGAHKDRNKAKELLFNDTNKIFEKIQSVLPQKYIFVSASLGGGTGSGLLPAICEVLIQKYKKVVMPVVVLPKMNESVTALKNAYQCMIELEQLKTGAMFILDNEKNNDIFEINKRFARQLNSLLSEKKDSNKGNMDKSEIKHMLASKGYSIIINLKDKALIPTVIKSVYSNIYAPIENDKVIKYIGISQSTDYDIISALTSELGQPLDYFIGYDDDETVVLLNGLSLPITRLNEIKEKVIQNKDNITNIMKSLKTQQLKNDELDFFDNIIDEDKKETKIYDTSDLLSSLL